MRQRRRKGGSSWKEGGKWRYGRTGWGMEGLYSEGERKGGEREDRYVVMGKGMTGGVCGEGYDGEGKGGDW